jgi:hypothetical protein
VRVQQQGCPAGKSPRPTKHSRLLSAFLSCKRRLGRAWRDGRKAMEATGMPHYSPYLVIVLIVVRLVFPVMAWCAKLRLERARVQGLALLLGAARPGVTVMRKSVNGSVLFVASAVNGASVPSSTPVAENGTGRVE